MGNLFMYEILPLTATIKVTLLNILIWIGMYFLARYCRKSLKQYITKKNIQNQQITLAGRDITLVSLSKQLINILFVILALQSLSITNNGSGLKELLDIKLISAGRFNVTVYSLFFLMILIVGAKLLTTFARLFIHRRLAAKQWIDKSREYTLTLMVEYLIYTICIVVGLKSFGVDITLLIASSAALFVGLGLGIQKIFADIVSGLIILFEGSIKVGDIVQIPEGQARIVQINIRTSKARTVGGNTVIIPNSKLTTENVSHWTMHNKSVRFSIDVYVQPESNADQVKQVLYDAALKHNAVDKRKNIVVLLEEFTDKNHLYRLFFWSERIWEIEVIKSDIRFAIEADLRKNNIALSSPKEK